MDECTHLIRDYLCKNPTAINWGYYVMSEDEELYYFETVQFASKVSASPDVDFILFGSYCNGRPQIFYIDRESYKHIGESTDLENADLHLSPLNKNEITVYGKF